MESIDLKPAPPGPALTRIRIGRGLVPALAADLRTAPLGSRHVLVTDDRVRPLHAEGLASCLRAEGLRIDLLSFPAGEASKTRDTVALLQDQLVDLGCGRDTGILAVGGGVVGDLAGFLAATYHRGLPHVMVPTTLLAMVDAAIGGKTGHDLPAGKNLVGAVHHPRAVWSDLDFLGTLPDRDLGHGFAEIVKAAAAGSRSLFEALEREAGRLVRRDPGPLERAVAAAARVKVEVVAEDPLELARRAVLNFGHTLGHAIESASGYAVPHGEAVAMGMAVEAEISVRRAGLPGLERDRLCALLERLGLPVGIPEELDADAIWCACARDKKARGGVVRAVLLQGLGRPHRTGDPWTVPIARRDLDDALKASRNR
ncbi:MAG: 3-dehydroquinate synthase [Acidobacteriota bacterium]